jgi:toxin ParE1/3/4
VYFAENAGIETAERFLLNADQSFEDLGRHPGIGAPLALRSPKLAGLRKWQVSGFERILIFYLPGAGGLSIVRVLHAAQDWWSLLEIV